ncbi:hypothetical protein TNCT_255981 [Trichonephila clavata]|uniref:Uncharacterized protein n=1 Tax=Trichonephila clavata TaxID=2740835 RepID=A0A8X6L9D9_TRICU|nr:hypothetical protein TNCT_255981 [Trichonephila clavata]
MTSRTEMFPTGKSSNLGEETSSKDQQLLNRIQSLEEEICQLSILHKSRMKERNSFRSKTRSCSGKRLDPKENIAIFTSVSVCDASLKNAVRLVHGIEMRKTSVCSKYYDKFCCRTL